MIDVTLTALEKVLDLRTQAHQVHTSNLANANVNDFKAKKIDFDAKLKQALEPTLEYTEKPSDKPQVSVEAQSIQQLNDVAAEVYEDQLAPMAGNGNTVNPDKEQAEIAKNMIGYQTAIQLVNKKMAMQKYILNEGGR
jgi:flagellar basal-body rod protein FlgB